MQNNVKELLQLVSEHGYLGRLGKLFQTNSHYYFLDTGTGKVARIDKYTHDILSCILESESPASSLQALPDTDEYNNAFNGLKNAIFKEHILSAPVVETLTGDAVLYLDQIIKDGLQNVTLEVTEQCNLRCKYCIYQEDHTEYRKFGAKKMSWETAKAAIDYLKDHSDYTEKPHVGFYGGEPLLNFEIIKRSVEYAKKVFDKELLFALTTNATLVTDEIAEFFAANGMNLIISLDGPKEMHDANRVFTDGSGSYEQTRIGIEKLVCAYKKRHCTEKLGFNIVVSGPDYEKDYDIIQHFFDNADWIPEDVLFTTSTVDRGPKDSSYVLPQSAEDLEYMRNAIEPNYEWEKNRRNLPKGKRGLIVDGAIDKGMLAIHKRLLLDKPAEKYGMNGCCVPGQRRIYVTADGRFLLCEKVGNIPAIGNVHTGLDAELIRKVYVDDFIAEATQYCRNCWAINLCSLCYVNCYDENGPHFAFRHNSCMSERKYIEENLIRYHTILESDPESLEHYNSVELE